MKYGFLMAGLFLLPAGAIAQDRWEEQVTTQLELVEELAGTEGYRRRGTYIMDSLRDDETDSFTVNLKTGSEYKLFGVCDTDCGDIEMWLYDENGNEIDKDVSDDDVPVVEVNPSWTGEFRIKIKMYDCSDEPCRYGIVTLQK